MNATQTRRALAHPIAILMSHTNLLGISTMMGTASMFQSTALARGMPGRLLSLLNKSYVFYCGVTILMTTGDNFSIFTAYMTHLKHRHFIFIQQRPLSLHRRYASQGRFCIALQQLMHPVSTPANLSGVLKSFNNTQVPIYITPVFAKGPEYTTRYIAKIIAISQFTVISRLKLEIGGIAVKGCQPIALYI